MLRSLVRSKYSYYLLFLYLVVLCWWIKLNYISGIGTGEAYLFNWFYGLIALSGSIYGLLFSSKFWGGWKSVIGRSMFFLSLGLLSQWLGLQVWTYYNVVIKIEVPYPSLADVGYFGLVPFYSLGAFMLALASGVKFSLTSLKGKIVAIVVPLCAFVFAFILFLRDIGFDLASPVKVFFDVAYPLGEIIPVTIAFVILGLSRQFLGGSMRARIHYLIFAFSFQFITEYLFLYKAGNGTYINGGLTDLMYASSYLIMGLGLVAFRDHGVIFPKVNQRSDKVDNVVVNVAT